MDDSRLNKAEHVCEIFNWSYSSAMLTQATNPELRNILCEGIVNVVPSHWRFSGNFPISSEKFLEPVATKSLESNVLCSTSQAQSETGWCVEQLQLNRHKNQHFNMARRRSIYVNVVTRSAWQKINRIECLSWVLSLSRDLERTLSLLCKIADECGREEKNTSQGICSIWESRESMLEELKESKTFISPTI